MPANPTSVQEARAQLEMAMSWLTTDESHHIDALIAAVRAERDAEIRGMVEGMRDTTPRDKQTRSFYIEGFNSALADVLRLLSDREGAKHSDPSPARLPGGAQG